MHKNVYMYIVQIKCTFYYVSLMSFYAGMKICSLRSGSCEVRYFLDRRLLGDESDIMVMLDDTQPSLVTLREGSTNCNPGTPIWPIFVGIILGTILVGVIVLVLWRCCTYVGVSDNTSSLSSSCHPSWRPFFFSHLFCFICLLVLPFLYLAPFSQCVHYLLSSFVLVFFSLPFIS